MNKLFYPALFLQEENGAYTVTFPDIPEAITCGDNLELAHEMAFDALGLALSYREDNKEEIPFASNPRDVLVTDNQFVMMIEFDMLAYKKKHNSKVVNKTLTIPGWLNELCMANKINFSQVLQESLISKLKSMGII